MQFTFWWGMQLKIVLSLRREIGLCTFKQFKQCWDCHRKTTGTFKMGLNAVSIMTWPWHSGDRAVWLPWACPFECMVPSRWNCLKGFGGVVLLGAYHWGGLQSFRSSLPSLVPAVPYVSCELFLLHALALPPWTLALCRVNPTKQFYESPWPVSYHSNSKVTITNSSR